MKAILVLLFAGSLVAQVGGGVSSYPSSGGSATLPTCAANTLLAGPASGTAATAACRAAVNADVPSTLTGITLDGVTPTVFGYLDASSSIQTQLNGKQASLTLPLSVANGGTGTASPGIVAGSNVTVSGTWPNQTVAATAGGVSISGTPLNTNLAQWTNSTTVKGVSQGVFNARLMYGAVPDGSTDNSTAITNAFTASNAFTSGTPTVYFDCDTSTTVCQYNYGGSGTSPINPTISTNVQCATGVYLNYTGSAHAVDLGSSGRTFQDELPYTIQGCTFTGAVSSTHGIYVNQWISNTYILYDTFYQFGNRTGYNIYYAGNNWESLVQGNTWYDHDGVTRNIMDAHNNAVNAIRVADNNVECDTAGHTACSISTIGVGFWLGDTSVVERNVIQYHGPLVRIANSSSGAGDRMKISSNHFEGNTGVLIPAITYGNPGTTGVAISCLEYSGNSMYYPVGTATPIVGPETAGSGAFVLQNCPFLDNMWSTPSSGTSYVVTGFGARNIWGRNMTAGAIITASTTSPGAFDFPNIQDFLPTARRGNGDPLTGLVSFQSNGQDLTAGSYHTVSAPLLCIASGGPTGTVQQCNTSPSGDVAGTTITPVAGDSVMFKTTVANTGDLTLNVNSAGAKHVRKYQGLSVLAAGDLQAGVYLLLTYDGAYWELASSAGGFSTPTNCSSSASPAVCAAASAGSVAIPTGVTSVALTVNTSAVTANSQILMFPDDTLGTKLGVTCNSTLATLVGGMAITNRTAGTSFEVTYNGTIATNPLCASYVVVN